MSYGSSIPPGGGRSEARPARQERGARRYQGRHSAAPKRRRNGRRVLAALAVMLTVLLLTGVAGAGYLWYRYNQIDRADLALGAAGAEDPKNYLIVGSDDRSVVSAGDADADAFLDNQSEPEPSGHRSDTIIIMRVDPRAETIDMVSFPRDLWVPIAGTRTTEKINAAYNAGPQRLVDTIKQNFGIDVHHYIEVDIASFKGIVEAVGGVPMYFDTPMRDTHSGLYVDDAGCTTLDGDQAIAFARARYLQYQDAKGRWTDDGTGDLGRINRQQLFVRKVIDKAAGRLADLDLLAVNDILSSTADNLRVDSAMDIGQMVELGRRFADFSGDMLVSHHLPVKEISPGGGTMALALDQVAARPVLNVFRGLPADHVTPGSVSVVIENGSGIAGQALEVGNALRAIGFVIESTGNAPSPNGATEVRFAPGAVSSGVEVAKHLPAGTRLIEDRDLPAGAVVVVTGPNLTSSSVSRQAIDVEAPPTTAPSTVVREGQSLDPEVIDEAIGVIPQEDPAASCT